MLEDYKKLQNIQIEDKYADRVFALALGIRGYSDLPFINGARPSPSKYMPLFTSAAKSMYQAATILEKEGGDISLRLDRCDWMNLMSSINLGLVHKGLLSTYLDYTRAFLDLFNNYSYSLGCLSYLENKNRFMRWIYRLKIAELRAIKLNWQREMISLTDKLCTHIQLKGEHIE